MDSLVAAYDLTFFPADACGSCLGRYHQGAQMIFLEQNKSKFWTIFGDPGMPSARQDPHGRSADFTRHRLEGNTPHVC